MVAHQTVGERVNTEIVMKFGQIATELGPVSVSEEHSLSVDTAIHHVVDPALGRSSSRTYHAGILTEGCRTATRQ